MDWLITRLVAVGAALVITVGIVAVTGLAGYYLTNHIRAASPAASSKPREYVIDLQPAHPHQVP